MRDDIEERIRSTFRRLRAEDEASAPELQTLVSRARGRTPTVAIWRRRSVLVFAAAAMVVIAVGLIRWAHRRPYPIDLATTRWRGPTDFLLAIPLDPGLSTVPRIGESALPWRAP